MENSFENFSDVRVLVVGDIMLDQYLWGEVERISPEAPVPIVHLRRKSQVVGGAANVAANIAGLGAKPYLVGVTGDDADGQILASTLGDVGVSDAHLIKVDRPTTLKTRIVAQNQQIVRLDQEDRRELDKSEEDSVWNKIEEVFQEIDIVLISDYAKGVITKRICELLISKTNTDGKYIIIDPKGTDFDKYKYASILTPNHKEALLATDSEESVEEKVIHAGQNLLEKLELAGVIVTEGEKGMTLFEGNKPVRKLNSVARKVYDVTGAGDTVIATLTVALGAGLDFYQATKLANIAAGIVVEKIGTTAINISDLKEELS